MNDLLLYPCSSLVTLRGLRGCRFQPAPRSRSTCGPRRRRPEVSLVPERPPRPARSTPAALTMHSPPSRRKLMPWWMPKLVHPSRRRGLRGKLFGTTEPERRKTWFFSKSPTADTKYWDWLCEQGLPVLQSFMLHDQGKISLTALQT